MITFKKFLFEKYSKEPIALADIEKLLAEKCSEFMRTSANYPILRGMNGAKSAYLVNGETGVRKSVNTTNHYTVILDEFLPKLGYPKRSASLICGTYANKSYVSSYGTIFAIIPFNGVKIGVCPEFDVFETKITLFNHTANISKWNDTFDFSNIRDENFKALTKDISEASFNINKLEPLTKFMRKAQITNKTESEIAELLKVAYTPPEADFSLETPSTLSNLNLKQREVWIGGKCIAVNLSLYNKLLNNNL